MHQNPTRQKKTSPKNRNAQLTFAGMQFVISWATYGLTFIQWKRAWGESEVDFPSVSAEVCTAHLWVSWSPKQKQTKIDLLSLNRDFNVFQKNHIKMRQPLRPQSIKAVGGKRGKNSTSRERRENVRSVPSMGTQEKGCQGNVRATSIKRTPSRTQIFFTYTFEICKIITYGNMEREERENVRCATGWPIGQKSYCAWSNN